MGTGKTKFFHFLMKHQVGAFATFRCLLNSQVAYGNDEFEKTIIVSASKIDSNLEKQNVIAVQSIGAKHNHHKLFNDLTVEDYNKHLTDGTLSDMKEELKPIITTIDQLVNLNDEIIKLNKFIFIDEIHLIHYDIEYRDIMNKLLSLFRKIINENWDVKIILASGTPTLERKLFSMSFKDKFHEIKVNKPLKQRVCNIRNLHAENYFLKLSQDVKNTIQKGKKAIIFINDNKEFQRYKTKLTSYNGGETLNIMYVSSKFTETDSLSYLIENEKIPDNIDIVITTEYSAAGINIFYKKGIDFFISYTERRGSTSYPILGQFIFRDRFLNGEVFIYADLFDEKGGLIDKHFSNKGNYEDVIKNTKEDELGNYVNNKITNYDFEDLGVIYKKYDNLTLSMGFYGNKISDTKLGCFIRFLKSKNFKFTFESVAYVQSEELSDSLNEFYTNVLKSLVSNKKHLGYKIKLSKKSEFWDDIEPSFFQLINVIETDCIEYVVKVSEARKPVLEDFLFQYNVLVTRYPENIIDVLNIINTYYKGNWSSKIQKYNTIYSLFKKGYKSYLYLIFKYWNMEISAYEIPTKCAFEFIYKLSSDEVKLYFNEKRSPYNKASIKLIELMEGNFQELVSKIFIKVKKDGEENHIYLPMILNKKLSSFLNKSNNSLINQLKEEIEERLALKRDNSKTTYNTNFEYLELLVSHLDSIEVEPMPMLFEYNDEKKVYLNSNNTQLEIVNNVFESLKYNFLPHEITIDWFLNSYDKSNDSDRFKLNKRTKSSFVFVALLNGEYIISNTVLKIHNEIYKEDSTFPRPIGCINNYNFSIIENFRSDKLNDFCTSHVLLKIEQDDIEKHYSLIDLFNQWRVI